MSILKLLTRAKSPGTHLGNRGILNRRDFKRTNAVLNLVTTYAHRAFYSTDDPNQVQIIAVGHTNTATECLYHQFADLTGRSRATLYDWNERPQSFRVVRQSSALDTSSNAVYAFNPPETHFPNFMNFFYPRAPIIVTLFTPDNFSEHLPQLALSGP
jgi:hypothetical protein